MRFAVISDIHANMEALQAVLQDIAVKGVDRIVCLGDCVGYGAQPEEVVRLLSRRRIHSLVGNHEEAVFDDNVLSWFNPQATESILRTREVLSKRSVESFHKWPKTLTVGSSLFVHGFPPDSVHTYLFEATTDMVSVAMELTDARVCFVGHTHILTMMAWDGMTVQSLRLTRGVHTLDSRRYIVNVGSVGQPRDGNNNAKYIIYEPGKKMLEVRFVPYDIKSAAKKIIAAGLPEFFARRLY
ncbi:MAG: metallophosphoesterase family protein [Thermodesulfobacteriota bacterium]